MTELWFIIIGLAAATFTIRVSGYVLASHLPQSGRWARGFAALPGCLIAALLSVILVQGGLHEWLAAAIALAIALVSRSLPLTMLGGIGAVYLLRVYL